MLKQLVCLNSALTIKAIPGIHVTREKCLNKVSLDQSIWNFTFEFIVHPLLLQVLEVMHCKKCTRVVVYSQPLWVNIIPVAWGVSRMILLSSWGQLPILNHKAIGESVASQQKKPGSPVLHLQQQKCCLVERDAVISCELQKRSLLEAVRGEGGTNSNTGAQSLFMNHADLSRQGVSSWGTHSQADWSLHALQLLSISDGFARCCWPWLLISA